MKEEKGALNELLSHTGGRYEIANGALAFVGTGLASFMAFSDMPNWGWQAWVPIVVCVVDAVIFISRAFWMRWARKRGMKLTDDRDNYSLERTTGFGWVVFLILGVITHFSQSPIDENADHPIVSWLIALVLWTPISSVVGSSMGKLKAFKDDREGVAWPSRGGEAWFERLASGVKRLASKTNEGGANSESPKERFSASETEKNGSGLRGRAQSFVHRNTMFLGNASLVLIQGGSFAAFQIVLINDDVKTATCLAILSMGIGIPGLLLTVKRSEATIFSSVMFIFLLAGGLIVTPAERLLPLIVVQFISLIVAAWMSTHIKPSGENPDKKRCI